MLDILKIAKEDGKKDGVLEGVRDMVIEISNKIYSISNGDTLSSLLKQAIVSPTLPEFKNKLGIAIK